jgi:ATP-binding cassette subfamily B protein
LLEAVDVAVEPGELVAVVGEVGSGKSVLLALLAGQRQPDDGRLCLGDVPLDQVRPALLAAAIGYVPQDPVLVSSTLRDNILLGREVGEGELERALDVSRLVADLHAFPDGLSTGVGERGVTLSGGQQQRVALARALVGRPSVLILDDATAALDADTEAMFWRRLEAVLPEVSAVVVTHRTATLQRADRVVVLERGRVVQAGDHGSLLAQEGAYRRIYGRFEARARVAG